MARVLSLILTTVFLSSCGGGGGGGSEPVPSPVPAPASPTSSLSACPTTLYVNESVTLTWSSTNATSCSASGEWSGDKETSGEQSLTVTKEGELTYTITCSSGSQSSTPSSVTISSNPLNQTGKYSYENNSHIYVESDKGNIFNTPLLWAYSEREHKGYVYPNSETGEEIYIDGGWFGNQIQTCRNANLNGDNLPDLVAQSGFQWQAQPTSHPDDMKNPERHARLHFMINQGDGHFIKADDLMVNNDYYRINTYKDTQVADMNNDGLDDFLTPSGGAGPLLWQTIDDGVLLLMSNTDGKYEDKTNLINFPGVTRDRGDFTEEVLGAAGTDVFVPVDVDGDGWKDIVTFTIVTPDQGYRFPLVLLNNEGQSFEPWDRFKNEDSPFLLGHWGGMRDAAAGDFDNDGDEDVFILCYQKCWNSQSPLYDENRNTGFVLINNEGDFKVEDLVHFPKGTIADVNKNDAMEVGDINGDGLLDVVIAQGKVDPYYVGRNIQILINNGEGFDDETDSRIENLLTDYNGQPEGNIYLVDYDSDGDLDIFDHQANVRNGYSSNSNAPTEEDKKFPYWRNGGSLFLNDGTGIFAYQGEDISDTGDLPNLFETWKMTTFNEPYFMCPVNFGEGYGYGIGFLGPAGEESSHITTPDGILWEDYSASGIALGRKISETDAYK